MLEQQLNIQKGGMPRGDIGREDLQTEIANLRRKLQEYEETTRQLRLELEVERGRNKILQTEVKSLREESVVNYMSAEQSEEQISNKLLRRISELKKEKASLVVQVEQEEEYLTNTLYKRLEQVWHCCSL